MTDRVLQNFNIFIDSDNCLSGKGDDFVLQLSSQGINALDGEKIRLSLMSFNMYKNFYNVNANNNEVVLRTDQTPQRTINLTPKNYSTIGKIAEELKIKLLPFLLTDAQSGGSTAIKIIASVLPSTSELLDDGDRIISMTLEFQDLGSNPVPHTLTSVILQSYEENGDSSILLGVDRVEDITDTTTNSFSIDFTSNPNKIFIDALYPAQRSTDEHIYLRTDLQSRNIETQSLAFTKTRHNTHSVGSDIFAKLAVDNEFIHFESATGNEFSIDILQKHINSIRMELTDGKHNPIGRRSGNTAGGSGSKQNTLGNLHFSCVLKVEVIKEFNINQLQTPQPISFEKNKNIGVSTNINGHR
jgi:hypothetical protein